MNKDLPIYKLVVSMNESSDLEVDAIALVKTPAIEKNWMTFNDKLRFTFSEERQIISGPAMLADVPIYRRNEQFGEHYVIFDKEQIGIIANSFLKKGYANAFNLFHNQDMPAEGVSLINSFVTDEQMGVMPMKGYEDTKDGSWFISAKVEDPSVWEMIKSGQVMGFSVEGMFKYKEPEKNDRLIAALMALSEALPDDL